MPITFGDHVFGRVDTTDVVDFYRFDGAAGNKVAFATINYGSMNLALTDAAMNPVPLVEPTPWAALPASGTYYLAVTDPYPSQWGNNYTFELVLLTGDEPNDTIDMATTVPFGPTLAVSYDYPCDVDWLRFEGRAGDVLAEMNTNVVYENTFLYSADGVRMRGVNVLPADGTYYLRTEGYFSDKWGSDCYEGAYDVDFGQALWVSAKADGLGGDASIKKGDIVTRKNAPNTWQIMFDASDVGITRNVVAFEYMPDGSLLMSFDRPQNIAGLGKVQPQDIVRFVPTSLGDNTAGTFEWFLDGSDVGLTTNGEKIDVIIMQRDIDNPLRISTTGSGSVPRVSGGTLKFRDEDLINFVGDPRLDRHQRRTPGVSALDGSTVPGMAAEDLNAGTRVELYPQRDFACALRHTDCVQDQRHARQTAGRDL